MKFDPSDSLTFVFRRFSVNVGWGPASGSGGGASGLVDVLILPDAMLELLI